MTTSMTTTTMMMTTTSALEALKASRKPAPLSTFLAIYNKAPRECFVNYMEGAEALHNWLTNDREIPLDLGDTSTKLKIPRLLLGYELTRLTGLIAGSQYGPRFQLVSRAIYKEVTK